MKSRGSVRELLANLALPLPLSIKLPKLLRNRLRAARLGGCCAHPGEPGC
jgi:hypothetical protein